MAVRVFEHESQALRNNPLGDPFKRRLHVIVPEDLSDGEPVACLWYLSGYASVSRGMLSDSPWQEGLEERLLRLRNAGKIGKVLVALPDCFNRFGGCQYLSSPVVGDYEAYLFGELLPLVGREFNVSAQGVLGKSSGGYGALVQAMKHPGVFAAVACHSGDMGFRMSIFPDIPHLMNALRDCGGIKQFLQKFDQAKRTSIGGLFAPMSMLALAAVYSPEASSEMGIGLPFDLARGSLREDVLERWLDCDPLRMLEYGPHQAALRALDCLFIDCGTRDEHFLHFGAQAFSTRATELSIPHHFETFSGGHRGTSHRLDVSLPALYSAVASNVG